MSGYTKGDARNCRNCQQPIHFRGVNWWHNHNESTFCSTCDQQARTRAEPDLDAQERVRAASTELLEALKSAETFEASLIGEWADFWDVAPQPLIDKLMKAQELRNAAIAKAESL